MNDTLDQLPALEFAYPWVLLLLLLVPIIAWWLGRPGALPSVTLPSLRPLRGLGLPPRGHTGNWRWILPLAASIRT